MINTVFTVAIFWEKNPCRSEKEVTETLNLLR